MYRLYYKLTLVITLVFLTASTLTAGGGIAIKKDNANDSTASNSMEYFKKLQESAHPTPLPAYVPYKAKGSYKLSQQTLASVEQYSLPKFLDTSMTIDDGPNSHQNESSIAVSPLDPDFLIGSAVDYRQNGDTWIYISRDGGKTWENRSLGKPFPTWRSTNDPSVAFDREGTAYLMYGAFPGANANPGEEGQNGVFVSISEDKGLNWDTHIPVILHNQPMLPDSTFEDKYYIHVDNSAESPFNGYAYTPWKRVTPLDSATQIVFTRSEDGARTWSEPVPISVRMPGTSEDTTFGQSFPVVTTDSKGNVYAVWNNGIVHGVGFNRSSDAGKTWETQRIIHNYEIFGETVELSQGWRHTVKGSVRAEAYPVIEANLAEGPYKDDIYVVWAADNPPNIYFSKSTDNGDTWSDAKIITETSENDQWWPWLGVDPESGDLAVMYLDSRNDPENILTECYVSYSQDGGETWIDRKASSAQFDVRRNPFQDRAFAGDYSGLDFRNGIIYPSWVDMRNVDTPQGWDSEVFTAIMDTKAPSPAENFVAVTLPEEPDQVALSWEPIFETTFGKQIDPSELRYRIERDGELVNILPSAITEFKDTAPEPFEEYEYTITALYDERESAPRIDMGYPGGAKQPLPLSLNDNDKWEELTFSVDAAVPSLRLDSITPLVNADSILVYLNDEFYQGFDINTSDTATVLTLSGNTPGIGWYEISAYLQSDFSQLGFGTQLSPESNTLLIASGSITEYLFAEESIGQTIVYADSNWKANTDFFVSGQQSIMLGGEERYDKNIQAPFILPPVQLIDEPTYLHFQEIVQTAMNDTLHVQVSTDMEEWSTIYSSSQRDKESWTEKELTPDDWREVHLRLDEMGSQGDIIFIRFLFSANNFLEFGEALLDNIQIDHTALSTEEITENNNTKAYYLPRDKSIYMDLDGLEGTFTATLYDIKGAMISRNESFSSSGGQARLMGQAHLGNLTGGIYILHIVIAGEIHTQSILIP